MDPISNFKGIFAREAQDNAPEDHLLDALNIYYPFGEMKTRAAMDKELTLANILRIFLYKRIDESPRKIILVQGGTLYDSTNLLSPLITISGMTDFSAVPFYNRLYISPHDGKKGLLNETVRVYDGTTLRVAGGTQPTGTMVAANSAVAGKVEAGTHLFAVVIQSPSGFLSTPGPVIFASVVAPGAKKIDLSGIPLGPPGTPARRIIATRSIQTYDGNQFGQEYFFLPNGTINDNTSTTFTVDFYDSELQDDANYLFDIRSTIPAGLIMGKYKGRMLVGNTNADRNLMLVSRVNEPETFDTADDLLVVDPSEASGITAAFEHHGMLIIHKSLKSYSAVDNTAEPNTWEVNPFDQAIGTEVHGIGTILDSDGTTIDSAIIAARHGLVLYNGTFRDPELTYKIKNIWTRINKNYFHTIEVAMNPLDKQIFIAAPLDTAQSPNVIIYADYSDGLSFENIKWSIWGFHFRPTSIIVDLINNSPVLTIGSLDGNTYQQNYDSLNDDAHAIDNYVQFSLAPRISDGIFKHFNFFRTKIEGAGNVIVTAVGQNGLNPQTYQSFALSAAAHDVTRKLNFVGPKCAIKLRLTNINEYMTIHSYILNFADLYQDILHG